MKASREIALLRALLAERLGGVGEQKFVYQAGGAQSGLTVMFHVYRPNDTEDVAQSDTADEVGETGRYVGSFIASGPGWYVLIDDSAGGHAVKQF